MLLLGIPEQDVMGGMDWATMAMAKRYQHISARYDDQGIPFGGAALLASTPIWVGFATTST